METQRLDGVLAADKYFNHYKNIMRKLCKEGKENSQEYLDAQSLASKRLARLTAID